MWEYSRCDATNLTKRVPSNSPGLFKDRTPPKGGFEE